VWCHNPEGIAFKPSLSFSRDRCNPTLCGGYACLEACPSNVFKKNSANQKIEINFDACIRCDECFDLCTPGALEPVGKWWQVGQLVNKVLADRHFFHATGGGITLSGGEPTLQMGFAHRFLAQLKKEAIHTGLETCGMFHLEKFRKYLLPYLDFVYFDLKLIAADESLQNTGCTN
jgi:pyruvate formate lyase activating enzyme